MKNSRSKVLSMVLALCMVVSTMVVPASAATRNTIEAHYNGSCVFLEDYPEGYNLSSTKLAELGVGIDVGVSITSGGYIDTTFDRPISMSGTLPNGTQYSITENSKRVVSLTADGIADDIVIAILGLSQQFTIESNSGPEGYKNNLGSTGSPTCSVSKESISVNGNESWSTTFTPDSGLTINSFNIRTSHNGKNIVSASAGSVTVGSTDISITQGSNGKVTVSSSHAADDLYITALTVEKAPSFSLNVKTNGGVTSNISSVNMEEGSTNTVKLTPDSGYIIDTITITDGGRTGIINISDSSVTVNGHTYRVTRNTNGVVTLSVPAVSSNVSIDVVGTNNKANVQVITDAYSTSNYPEQSYLNIGSTYSIKLSPKDDAEIIRVRVVSATDSISLDYGSYRFLLDGLYYSVSTHNDGSMTLNFHSLPGSLKIFVESKETHHTVTLKTSSGCDYEGNKSKFTVEDGDSVTFSFIPDANKSIEELAFSYGDKTYRVDRNDSYIKINGARCPITWENSGRVTVTLHEVAFAITVKANTEKGVGDGDHEIEIITDGGVDTTSSSSTVYADNGKTATITFKPVSNYEIEEIIITRGGKEYSVEKDKTSVTINGTKHTISWQSNGRVTVTLKDVTADMTVEAVSDYSGNSTVTRTITKKAGSHSSISLSTKTNKVGKNESFTVTIAPDDNYYLKSVVIKVGNNSKTIYTTTDSFTLNNNTYTVRHYADGSMSIYFSQLGADMTVTSTAAKGTDPNESKVTIYEDKVVESDYHGAYIAGIGNGQFAPNRTTTRAEAVVMLTRAFYDSSITFNSYNFAAYGDVPVDAWYASYIGFANSQGLLTNLHGVGANFRPNDAITRAEYTELVCRFAKINATNAYSSNFTDVSTSHWAYSTISYASYRGWVSGYPNGTFAPDQTITRAELVTLTNRVLGRNSDSTFFMNNSYNLITFADVPTSYWAYYDILEAANSHYYNH